MTLRICFMSDLHHGRNSLRKEYGDGTHGMASKMLLGKLVSKNKTADIIVSLGDMIREESVVADAKRLTKVRALLGKDAKVVIGNHDVKFLNDKEIKKCLNISRFYYSFIAKDVQFIVLYSWARKHHGRYGDVVIKKRQVRWLSSTLAKANLPVIILNHYPLDEQDITGVPYEEFFRKYPHRIAVANRSHIRKIFEKSKKVIAVFSGHLHRKNKTVIHGIPYYSVPSLTENKANRPCGEWTLAEINGRHVQVTQKK